MGINAGWYLSYSFLYGVKQALKGRNISVLVVKPGIGTYEYNVTALQALLGRSNPR